MMVLLFSLLAVMTGFIWVKARFMAMGTFGLTLLLAIIWFLHHATSTLPIQL